MFIYFKETLLMIKLVLTNRLLKEDSKSMRIMPNIPFPNYDDDYTVSKYWLTWQVVSGNPYVLWITKWEYVIFEIDNTQ